MSLKPTKQKSPGRHETFENEATHKLVAIELIMDDEFKFAIVMKCKNRKVFETFWVKREESLYF